MPVTFALRVQEIENISNIPGIPKFNPMMLLHGEENLEIYKNLVPG
jgi:hypothetical protein